MSRPTINHPAQDVASLCRRALAYPAFVLFLAAVAWLLLAVGPGLELFTVLGEAGMPRAAWALLALWALAGAVFSAIGTMFFSSFKQLPKHTASVEG